MIQSNFLLQIIVISLFLLYVYFIFHKKEERAKRCRNYAPLVLLGFIGIVIANAQTNTFELGPSGVKYTGKKAFLQNKESFKIKGAPDKPTKTIIHTESKEGSAELEIKNGTQWIEDVTGTININQRFYYLNLPAGESVSGITSPDIIVKEVPEYGLVKSYSLGRIDLPPELRKNIPELWPLKNPQ